MERIPAERRKTPRRRVCLGGCAQAAAFLPPIDCGLRDVSLGGARLRVSPEDALPGVFDLHVPARGETRRVRVVWRAAGLAGVRFEADAPWASSGPAPEADPTALLLRPAPTGTAH